VHRRQARSVIPVNGTQNILHLCLSAAGIVSALLTSRGRDPDLVVGTRRHAGVGDGQPKCP
jgi:hypothetical protein